MSAGVRRGQKVSDGASGGDCRRQGVLSACVGDLGKGVRRGCRQRSAGIARGLQSSEGVGRHCERLFGYRYASWMSGEAVAMITLLAALIHYIFT